MDNNKYLDEEKFQKNAKKVKNVGKILVTIGIILIIASIVLLVLSFLGFGKTGLNSISNSGLTNEQIAKGMGSAIGFFALSGILGIAGFSLIGLGQVVLVIGYRREIMAFTTQQAIPVAKEGINEMAPTIGNAAGEIAKGIKNGLNEADKKDE